MKRVVYSCFLILATGSLVLCFAFCVLWIRSYWVGEIVYFRLVHIGDPPTDVVVVSVRSSSGGVRLSSDRWAAWELGTRKPFTEQTKKSFDYNRFDPSYPYALNQTWFRRWGFEWSGYDEEISPTSVGSGIIRERNFIAPYWSLAVLTILLPIIVIPGWIKQRTIRRRRELGLCIRCGYDLRATPEQCPECGLKITPSLNKQ